MKVQIITLGTIFVARRSTLQRDSMEENMIQGCYIQQSCLPRIKDLGKTVLNVRQQYILFI